MLAIELLVVAALFAGALKLWNVRQDLHRELTAAQQIEAALQAAQPPPEQPALRKSKAAWAAGQALATMAAAADAPTRPRQARRQIDIEVTYEQRIRDHHR